VTIIHTQSEILVQHEITHKAAVPAPYVRSACKRSFDIIAAGSAILFLLPFLLVIYAFIRLESGSPALFKHTRIGMNKAAFKCWKFRTMVVDADEQLKKLLEQPELAREWAANQKLQNDPRITKIGAFLRKTSLDELPQLWNILVGDMSFVGPRPVTRAETKRYGHQACAYFSIRPGLTGPWQVGGRSSTSFSYRVNLDVEYSENATFLKDCVLILKTATLVFGDRTAA
jgi:exopolysaccharide production protein ExoY